MATPVFDFSLHDTEDVVVRTIDMRDEDRWVDVLVTPCGRRALWGWSEAFDSAEEAKAWVKGFE